MVEKTAPMASLQNKWIVPILASLSGNCKRHETQERTSAHFDDLAAAQE